MAGDGFYRESGTEKEKRLQCPVLQTGGIVGPENLEGSNERHLSARGLHCPSCASNGRSLSLARLQERTLPPCTLTLLPPHTHTQSLCLSVSQSGSSARSCFVSPPWSAERR